MQSAEAKTTKHDLTGEGCVTQSNSYLFLQILDIIHDIHPRQCNFTATGSVFYIKPCLFCSHHSGMKIYHSVM